MKSLIFPGFLDYGFLKSQTKSVVTLVRWSQFWGDFRNLVTFPPPPVNVVFKLSSGLASSPTLRKIGEKEKEREDETGKEREEERGTCFHCTATNKDQRSRRLVGQSPVRLALLLILYNGQSKRIKTISLSIKVKYDVIGGNWV